MTLRAGCAGAAARHHGPHLRAMPDLLSVGAREWSPRSNKRMTTVWLNQLLDCRLLAKRCDDRLNPGSVPDHAELLFRTRSGAVRPSASQRYSRTARRRAMGSQPCSQVENAPVRRASVLLRQPGLALLAAAAWTVSCVSP